MSSAETVYVTESAPEGRSLATKMTAAVVVLGVLALIVWGIIVLNNDKRPETADVASSAEDVMGDDEDVYQELSTDQPPAPQPVDCQVSDWSSWTACSKTCGGGSQSRTRTVTQQPLHGGSACPSLNETRACNTQPCPVDCQVSAWGAWTACQPGVCLKSRRRTVNRQPAHGGRACPSLTETQRCTDAECRAANLQQDMDAAELGGSVTPWYPTTGGGGGGPGLPSGLRRPQDMGYSWDTGYY